MHWPGVRYSSIQTNTIIRHYLFKMSSYSSYSFASTEKIRYMNKADPSWSIDKKLAWFKRREYLRTHKDALIPDDCKDDKEYHHWWHTKGKFQSMKHYVDGEQVIY